MTTNTDTPVAATESNAARIDERDRRALTETLLVKRDADALFRVYGEDGSEYVVDLREPVCTCPDFQYRGVRCKHIRRVELETGTFDVDALREEIRAATDEVDERIADLAARRAALLRLDAALDRFDTADAGDPDAADGSDADDA